MKKICQTCCFPLHREDIGCVVIVFTTDLTLGKTALRLSLKKTVAKSWLSSWPFPFPLTSYLLCLTVLLHYGTLIYVLIQYTNIQYCILVNAKNIKSWAFTCSVLQGQLKNKEICTIQHSKSHNQFNCISSWTWVIKHPGSEDVPSHWAY